MKIGTLTGTCEVEISFDVTNMLPMDFSEDNISKVIDDIFHSIMKCKNYTLYDDDTEILLDENAGLICGSYEFEGTWYEYSETYDNPIDNGEEYNTLDYFNSKNLIQEIKEMYPQLNIDIYEDPYLSIKYN